MKKIIKKYIPVLEFINSLSEGEKKKSFKNSNLEITKFLSDLLYNLNASNIQRSGIFHPDISILRVQKKKKAHLQIFAY